MINAIHGLLFSKNRELFFNSSQLVAGTTPYSIWDQLKEPATNHPFTVEHWIRPASNITTQQDIINFIPNDSAIGFRTVIFNGKLITNFLGPQNIITAGVPLTPNEWQFTAHSYDGTTCREYRGTTQADFVQVAQGGPYTWNYFNVGSQGMVLGSQRNSLQPFLGGSMDLIRIWSIPRTEAECKASMSQILPAGTPGLVAQWVPENFVSSGIQDTSGNGNTLAITGLRIAVVNSTASPFIF
jgi:hypothetical protein